MSKEVLEHLTEGLKDLSEEDLDRMLEKPEEYIIHGIKPTDNKDVIELLGYDK